ncbi:MAG: DUF3103 family protein [Cyclobacteriaceae bacterium]
MILNNQLRKAALALLLLAVSIACQDKPEETASPAPLPPAAYSTDDPGYTLAQSLATAIQSPQVRYFVKEKIDQYFDGDANFLYAMQQHQPVGGGAYSRGMSFEEALFGKDETGLRRAAGLRSEPLLQVALRKAPGVTTDWDPAHEQPVVVYLPYGTDIDEVSSLPAFDKQGNYFAFDVSKLPAEPILVISHNERVQPVPRLVVDKLRAHKANSELAPDNGCLLAAEPVLVTEDAYYYTTSDVYCSGPGGMPLQPGGVEGGQDTQDDCDREGTNLYDHISRIKFKSMKNFNAAEHYFDGAPEIYFFVFTGSDEGHLQSFKKFITVVDRSEWKDCPLLSECYPEWHYPDQEVFYWNKAQFGEVLKYQWFEHDDGDPVKFTSNYTVTQEDGSTVQLGFEVNITEKDEDLGHALAYFCEDATATDYKVYDTGSVYFALELR